jgi:pyruvate ferredoxin oxidoreductase alpha subunit
MVLLVVNRALSGPINIHCDHSDGMGARDTGWIQLYGENAQEAYDNCIQAVTISERLDVRLPVMNCFDGFLVSHAYELVEVETDDAISEWIGDYKAVMPLLDIENPYSMGPLDLWDYYFEHKRAQIEVYPTAMQAVIDEGKRFGAAFGREYGLMECVDLEDAEVAIIALGSTAGMCKDVVEDYRSKGIKAGLLKLRCFRPFPAAEIAAAIGNCKAVCVLDRAASYGAASGPLFSEVASAMYTAKADVPLTNIIYGLGGREIRPEQIATIYDMLQDVKSSGQPANPVSFLGVRE